MASSCWQSSLLGMVLLHISLALISRGPEWSQVTGMLLSQLEIICWFNICLQHVYNTCTSSGFLKVKRFCCRAVGSENDGCCLHNLHFVSDIWRMLLVQPQPNTEDHVKRVWLHTPRLEITSLEKEGLQFHANPLERQHLFPKYEAKFAVSWTP